jgi:ubiquinone/menaquinone biosynthesis C-methylase UbiE
MSNKKLNGPNLQYGSVFDFSGKELVRALTRKILFVMGIIRSPNTMSSDEMIVRNNIKAETEYFANLSARIRPQMLHDPDARPAELMAEKMWPWFVKSSGNIRNGWAVQWIQDHPSDGFGTTNENYRRKWLKKTLEGLTPGQTILDAGAGERQYQEYCRHLEYTSQDFAQYNGHGDGDGLQMGSWNNEGLDIVSDITSIPVADNSFDVIMCTEVFEHIPKPLTALREFTRIIKPGGTLILTAPFAAMTHFAPYFFYTGYSRYFYETSLKEMGYEIEEMDYNGNYFEYIAQELHRYEEIAKDYDINHEAESSLERLARNIISERLSNLGKKDKRTKELLCNGIHIRAKKL